MHNSLKAKNLLQDVLKTYSILSSISSQIGMLSWIEV